MTRDNTDEIPTLDTSAEGLDALADALATDLGINRDALRETLAQFENVVYDPRLGRAVRMVEHETVGDWTRVALEPFLRLVPSRRP